MTQRRVRIEIKDLPKGMKVTREEMRKIMGGGSTVPVPDRPAGYIIYPTWWRYGQSGGGCGCGCG